MSDYDQSLMWYYINHYQRYKKAPKEWIDAIAREISDISLIVPFRPQKEYRQGEIKSITSHAKLKLIKVLPDNSFQLKGIKKSMTPLQFEALLYYATNRKSGWQLTDKVDWIKLAHRIMKNGKKKTKGARAKGK